MDSNKQKLLLEYMVSSPDTFALCKGIVKSGYFNPEFRKTVDFLHEYYDKYSTTPDFVQIQAETNVDLEHQVITRDKIKWCSDEVLTFCRRREFELIVTAKAPKLIAMGEHAELEKLIRDAMAISLVSDLGISYFDNPEERIEKMLATPQRTSMGWPLMDDLMSGGIARGEMVLFSANSGGGKSITLANMAVNFLHQKKNVLYISLELSEELIAQRFDMMYTGISSVLWTMKHGEIKDQINKLAPDVGKLFIKRMASGTTPNQIRAYLKEFELKTGIVPDLLIVDYLDIMGANEKVSADNVFEKDKRATEQLRDILIEYNMYGATASQQNRGAIDAQELNQGHIAGGISKVNTVDWYFSIVMTPQMKVAGEVIFVMLKARSSDGVGKQIALVWDNNSLRILNPGREDDSDRNALELSRPPGGPKPKVTLDDLIGF